MVKRTFQYSADTINSLEMTLSKDRLASYLSLTDNNKVKALELYAWNTEISAELYSPLQGLEIAMRNSLHRELTNVFGESWYDNPKIPFNHISQDMIGKAKDTLNKTKKTLSPSNVIAELSLGFWITLLSSGKKGAYHNKLDRKSVV